EQAVLHQASLALAEELSKVKLGSNANALRFVAEDGQDQDTRAETFSVAEAKEIWQNTRYGPALQARVLRLVREKTDLSFLVNLLQKNKWLAVAELQPSEQEDGEQQNQAAGVPVAPDVFGGLFYEAAKVVTAQDEQNTPAGSSGAQVAHADAPNTAIQQNSAAARDALIAKEAYVAMSIVWDELLDLRSGSESIEDPAFDRMNWILETIQREIGTRTGGAVILKAKGASKPFWRAVRYAAVQRYVFHDNLSDSQLNTLWDIVGDAAAREEL
ncbi:unnamed protein product, partial [Amoebophrya sp. A120]